MSDPADRIGDPSLSSSPPPPPSPTASASASASGARSSWLQRHRSLAIAAILAAILIVTVLTDLPVSTSRASDIGAESSVMSEVNGDVGPCALAVHQALGIWTLQATHQLSAADRAPTPGLLSDDQTACSFASEGIDDLADIQPPGTPAGKHLGAMVATTMLWTTSDALRAIEDVQTLMSSPKNLLALRSLATAKTQLDADRGSAIAQEQAADRSLQTHLEPVDLPAISASRRG